MKIIFSFLLCFFFCSAFAAPQGKDFTISTAAAFLDSDERWGQEKFEGFMAQKGVRFDGGKTLKTSFLRKQQFFGVPAVEMRVYYTAENKLEQIDLVYANKGDNAGTRNMNRTISRNAKALVDQFTAAWGKPVSKKYGIRGNAVKALAWKTKHSEVFLEYVRSEYVIVHFHIGDSRNAVSVDEKEKINLKGKDFSQNVVRNKFGDAYIANIPMVNQGSKGYCAPATIERVLRYYGINKITMHSIADQADTRKGGGTMFQGTLNALASLGKSVNLTRVSCGDFRMPLVKRYIDMGLPIFWSMDVNPQYEKIRNESRTLRPRAKSVKEWNKHLKTLKVPSRGNGHLCLVIGYNMETEEIAVSNSWGAHEIQPTWVPLRIARKVSHGKSLVLLPPGSKGNRSAEKRTQNSHSRR